MGLHHVIDDIIQHGCSYLPCEWLYYDSTAGERFMRLPAVRLWLYFVIIFSVDLLD